MYLKLLLITSSIQERKKAIQNAEGKEHTKIAITKEVMGRPEEVMEFFPDA